MSHKFRSLSCILAIMLALTACTIGNTGKTDVNSEQNTGKASATKLTVGLTYIPDIQFSPLYVAAAKGYFQEAGLDVNLRHHGPQETLFGALQAGEEDIVFAGGDEMMQARSTGIDVVNWATMYQQYPVLLIAPKAAQIKSWSDLAGKKVGLPGPYGENYYGLLAALQIHGLTDKVQIEFIGYTQAAALQAKRVDAIIGFANNDPIALRNAGLDVVNIGLTDGTQPPLVGVGFGSMSNNIHPEVYHKFLHCIERAVQEASADPETVLTITEKYVPSLSEATARKNAREVLQETLRLYRGTGEFGQQNPTIWKQMAKFLAENNILEGPVAAEESYTTAVLTAASN
ncbi:ABC transporter substrate-binding protein [Arcanobacterium hippocoleae]